MNIKSPALFLSISLLFTLCVPIMSQADTGDSEPAASADNQDSIWTRDKLFGDWGGLRTDLANHGIAAEIKVSQFYQNVVDGGVESGGAYGGLADYIVNVDGHKLGLWQGLIANVHVQTAFGNFDSFAGKPGEFTLANSALLYPLAGDARTEVTGWLLGQFLSEEVLVLGGKLNSVDLQTSIFPHVDYGLSGFQNTNLVAPTLPWFQFVQLSMMGAGIELLDPRGIKAAAVVYDPQNSSTTSGFDDFFDDVAGLALYRFFFDLNEKAGEVTFVVGASSKSYSRIEQSSWVIGNSPRRQLVIPNGFKVESDTGAWNFTAYFNQILWQADPKSARNIRLFTGITFGPDEPAVSTFSSFATLEATGYFPGRPKDKIGVGGFYNEISDSLRETMGILQNPLEDSTAGIELYYNAEILPSTHLSGSIQFVDSATKSTDTAVIPGLRLVVDF
jgi:porin